MLGAVLGRRTKQKTAAWNLFQVTLPQGSLEINAVGTNIEKEIKGRKALRLLFRMVRKVPLIRQHVRRNQRK